MVGSASTAPSAMSGLWLCSRLLYLAVTFPVDVVTVTVKGQLHFLDGVSLRFVWSSTFSTCFGFPPRGQTIVTDFLAPRPVHTCDEMSTASRVTCKQSNTYCWFFLFVFGPKNKINDFTCNRTKSPQTVCNVVDEVLSTGGCHLKAKAKDVLLEIIFKLFDTCVFFFR